jgi:hypothetical protein
MLTVTKCMPRLNRAGCCVIVVAVVVDHTGIACRDCIVHHRDIGQYPVPMKM